MGRLVLADGRAALPLQSVESAPGRAVFAKPARAFPAPIVYWRDGADLLARVEGTVSDRAVARDWRHAPGTGADR